MPKRANKYQQISANAHMQKFQREQLLPESEREKKEKNGDEK